MFASAVVVRNGPYSNDTPGLAGRLLRAGLTKLQPAAQERSRARARKSLSERIVRAARDFDSDLVVVGCDIGALSTTITQASAAMPQAGRPVLVVPSGVLDARAVAWQPPEDLLRHVVVLADYAFDAPCASACAVRLARQGAERVTLQHSHGIRPTSKQLREHPRELEWVDFVRIELFKDRLLQAGAQWVDFRMDESKDIEIAAEATVVVLSAHCDSRVVEKFATRMARLASGGAAVPAVLIPPGSCCGS